MNSTKTQSILHQCHKHPFIQTLTKFQQMTIAQDRQIDQILSRYPNQDRINVKMLLQEFDGDLQVVCSVLANGNNNNSNNNGNGNSYQAVHIKYFCMGSESPSSANRLGQVSEKNNGVLKSTLLYLHRRYMESIKEKQVITQEIKKQKKLTLNLKIQNRMLLQNVEGSWDDRDNQDGDHDRGGKYDQDQQGRDRGRMNGLRNFMNKDYKFDDIY